MLEKSNTTANETLSLEEFQQDKNSIINIPNREEEEKKILRALDIRIMPLFCVFYFVDFLDRANIGNATLAGIQDDLNLSPKQLSMAISAFYITYIIFEVPSNIVLKRVNAVAWLSLIMLLWGIMTIVMAFAKDFTGLLVCRLLLGATESGYVPGILYMMSKLYRPREFGLRLAFLLCMSSISGIVSGPIAYGTSFMEGHGGLHGWQFLFILEGVPTVLLSVISYFYLFDDAQKAPWLTETQKKLHKYYTNAPDTETPTTVRNFFQACYDWKTLLFSIVYFLNATTLVSYQVFTPTIINEFGFPVLTSQLLSAPPNVMQTIMTLLGGYLTDKYSNKRGRLMGIGFFLAAIGYLLLIVLEGRWGRYGSLFIISSGLGLQAPANVGWSSINFPNLEIRAIAVAIVVMVGNSGGIVSSYLYPLSDGPHFYFGNIFNLCCAVLGSIFSILTSYLLFRENRKLDQDYQEFDEKEIIQFRYYY